MCDHVITCIIMCDHVITRIIICECDHLHHNVWSCDHLHHNVWSLPPTSLLHTSTSSGCKSALVLPLHSVPSEPQSSSTERVRDSPRKLRVSWLDIAHFTFPHICKSCTCTTMCGHYCILFFLTYSSTTRWIFFKCFLFPIRYPFVVCWYVKFPFHIFQDHWLSGWSLHSINLLDSLGWAEPDYSRRAADCITVDTGTNIALVSETGMEFAMPNGFTLYPSMITVSSEKQFRALYLWVLYAHVLHC